MKPKALLTCFTAIAIAVSACSERHGNFGLFHPVPQQGWAYGDTLMFDVNNLDNAAAGRKISIAVRHNADYPYRNLALEVTYRNGQRVVLDTVNMELADIYGSWKGNGLGPQRQMEATVAPVAALPDSSRISVRHVMRVDTLRGISEIGILIENP